MNKFPDIWKKTRLVLREKSKKTVKERTKYRPICLVSSLGKVYENLIKKRVNDEIDERGGLHEMQYEFRSGRSTVNAIEKVIKTAKGNDETRTSEWCALILIDVKNAFNTADWKFIIDKLQKREIFEYLVSIIKNHLNKREVQINRNILLKIGGGVPQGSVLVPTLWNVLYDDIMRIDVPDGTTLICYADDLAM